MSVTHYLRRAVSMPPHKAVVKAAGIVRRRIDEAHRRRRDITEPTFAAEADAPLTLLRYFAPLDVALLRPRREPVAELAHRMLEHRFNLLGSGWVRVAYGMECRGVEGRRYGPGPAVVADRDGDWLANRLNRANLAGARAVWQLVGPEYAPIDWQLDFKSGWRWSERTWSKRIRYGQRPGADIKVPWELARMQHLPGLVWAFALAGDGEIGFDTPDVYMCEFRNQVLDFTATNPPRFGVNWCCTMDVGIRVANWLVAYDLFRAAGAVFDEPFERVFAQSILEHGRHIVGHLEWNPELRSNHYLANIAGLLFAAAWLPGSEADEWLAFAIRELARETKLQFTPDGANFEASTSYHRLSAEMVTWATAVALALPAGKRPSAVGDCPLFPSAHFDRLERMAEFTVAATRPDGRIAQIGDNDSGRFLKLCEPCHYLPGRRATVKYPDGLGGTASPGQAAPPVNSESIPARPKQWHEPREEEQSRDHRHLVAAIHGLVGGNDFESFAGDAGIESQLIRSLRRGATSGRPRRPGRRTPDRAKAETLSAFPDFGLYVLRNPRVWLALRAGPVGQNGNGGHAHNDQLTIELCLDGVPFVVDPGTALYTPFPDLRNRFRATAAHSTLVVSGREQNAWRAGQAGLFSMRERSHARVSACTEHEIIAEHAGYGVAHRRTVRILPEGIAGRDECAFRGRKWVAFQFDPAVQVESSESDQELILIARGRRAILKSSAASVQVAESLFSPGYGEIKRAIECRLCGFDNVVEWSITVDDDGA